MAFPDSYSFRKVLSSFSSYWYIFIHDQVIQTNSKLGEPLGGSKSCISIMVNLEPKACFLCGLEEDPASFVPEHATVPESTSSDDFSTSSRHSYLPELSHSS